MPRRSPDGWNEVVPQLENDLLHDRIVYLESELDRLGKDVERLEEEGRFLQNLLSERAESGELPPGRRSES